MSEKNMWTLKFQRDVCCAAELFRRRSHMILISEYLSSQIFGESHYRKIKHSGKPTLDNQYSQPIIKNLDTKLGSGQRDFVLLLSWKDQTNSKGEQTAKSYLKKYLRNCTTPQTLYQRRRLLHQRSLPFELLLRSIIPFSHGMKSCKCQYIIAVK